MPYLLKMHLYTCAIVVKCMLTVACQAPSESRPCRSSHAVGTHPESRPHPRRGSHRRWKCGRPSENEHMVSLNNCHAYHDNDVPARLIFSIAKTTGVSTLTLPNEFPSPILTSPRRPATRPIACTAVKQARFQKPRWHVHKLISMMKTQEHGEFT